MEYRIHSRNDNQISCIGLNFGYFETKQKNYDSLTISKILHKASENKINFLAVHFDNLDLYEIILNWEKENNITFIHLVRFLDVNFDQNFQSYISKLDNLKNEFLSIYYNKLDNVNELINNLFISNLKKKYLIESFGIYCSNLTDAQRIVKFEMIDHLEIEIDINTSSDILNSIFKNAKKRNIAIICHQKEKIKNFIYKNNLLDDSLTNLLKKGENIFIQKLDQQDEILGSLFDLTLKKNLMDNYQTVLINVDDHLEIQTSINNLSQPFLTSDQLECLLKVISPIMYESPKN